MAIPCCLAVLVALTLAEAETKPDAAVANNNEVEKKQDANVEATDGSETAKNKRGLHSSLGDFASFGGGHGGYAYGGDYGGGYAYGGSFDGYHGGYGNHDVGASEHHHEHVKHITIEKKIPVPYTITKHVPVTIEKKVPYEVKVPIPQPYYVEKVFEAEKNCSRILLINNRNAKFLKLKITHFFCDH